MAEHPGLVIIDFTLPTAVNGEPGGRKKEKAGWCVRACPQRHTHSHLAPIPSCSCRQCSLLRLQSGPLCHGHHRRRPRGAVRRRGGCGVLRRYRAANGQAGRRVPGDNGADGRPISGCILGVQAERGRVPPGVRGGGGGDRGTASHVLAPAPTRHPASPSTPRPEVQSGYLWHCQGDRSVVRAAGGAAVL